MSRPVIPSDVNQLIEELTPVISPGSKPMDIIRYLLIRAREDYIIKSQLPVNDPASPYFNRTTPSEDLGLEESFADLEKGKYLQIQPNQDILTELNRE